MDDDSTGMTLALGVAAEALGRGELPVGAVVILNHRVVARAHTREREEARFLVHAELEALLDFDRMRLPLAERRRAVLVTTVEPCLMCLGAAMSAFVGRLVYSLPSETDGAARVASSIPGARPGFAAYQLPALQGGVMQDRSRQLFQAYIDRTEDGPLRRWASSLVSSPVAR